VLLFATVSSDGMVHSWSILKSELQRNVLMRLAAENDDAGKLCVRAVLCCAVAVAVVVLLFATVSSDGMVYSWSILKSELQRNVLMRLAAENDDVGMLCVCDVQSCCCRVTMLSFCLCWSRRMAWSTLSPSSSSAMC
jgi:hypothetical protein